MSGTFRSTKDSFQCKNNNNFCFLVFYFLSTATEYYTVSVRLNHIHVITYTNNSLFKCQIVVTKITHEEKAERENKQKADSSE